VGTTHNDVLSVGMCPKMRSVGVAKKRKKGQKLSCVKLAICPDHPRRHRPLKFCMRGCVREIVIYFKFHENRWRGLRAVEGRKSPSPIDLAHGLYNSCTTVQAVILAPSVEQRRAGTTANCTSPSCDQDHILKICAYFEVHRHFSF